MRGINVKYFMRAGIISLSLILIGCVSIPNSPTPRFYALSTVDGKNEIKKINTVSDLIIGVGPVKIPEYQDRPQIVTITKEKTLQFAQFDRWGESLDVGVVRLIREDLTAMLPKAKLILYPWNPLIPVKYQVTVEVVQLDSELNGDMFFVVQWMIIDLPNSKTVMIKRSEFRQPIIPQNYAGMAQTLSTACASLSGQIAEAFEKLQEKKNIPAPSK